MGRPKALCDFFGRSCLQLALDACRDALLARPIVVLGFSADEIRAHVRLENATVRINDSPGSGELSSLKTGLTGLPSFAGAFLLYPVDFPLVTAVDIQPLVAGWQVRRGQQRIFIPSHERRRGYPILFDIALRDGLLQLGDAAPLLACIDVPAHQIADLEADMPYVLMNMDTPKDYARCLAEFRYRAMGSRRIVRDASPGEELR